MEISKYCYYGTPFEEMEESEGVSKKPLTIENQIVTDEKGRRRFHGAFTGGFSAGYFNTVGTKEGWVPSNFVSSRSSRSSKKDFLPEDFMDKEDLGEHGIAPRLIKTTSFFTEKDVNSESESRSQESRVWDHRELAAETEKLAELLQPVNDSIGFVLLKRMGWRPGKGIGPLVNKQNLEMIADNGEKEKIYGCQLPPGLTKTGTQDENVLLKPDGYKVSVEDIDVHMFNSKTDLHGLGYKGLMAGDILSERRVLKTTQFQQSKSRKGIFGQAFGVGAFEEEDVDIYSVEDLSNYDFSIGLQPSTKDSKTAEATEEFVIGTEKLQRKFYPPPKIPRDFKPEHVPLHEENPVTAVAAAATVEGSGKKHVSKKSSRIIEATAAHWDDSSSVFSLLKQSDRERLMKLKAVNEAREQRHKSSTDETSKAASRTIEEEMKPSAPVVDSRMFGADRKKDELYKEFVTYLKRGLLMPVPAGVTEWEWESYKTEFAEHVPENLKENMELTKHGSKPLASNHISKVYEKILHSKFTHGQQDEDDEDERRTAGDEDLIKAVEMKMFGAMTRQKYTWHPDKLLCRRFNVPNPFPDTNFVGIPELRKANKSSMLLDFDSFSSSSRRTEEKEPIITRAKHREPQQPSEPGPSFSAETLHDESTCSSTSSEDIPENLGTVKAEELRPPMDVFRAIFASSESESDESEVETTKVDTNANMRTSVTDVSSETSRASKVDSDFVHADENVAALNDGSSEKDAPSSSIDTTNLEFHNQLIECSEKVSLISTSHEAEVTKFSKLLPSCDFSYGPALPPEPSNSPGSVLTIIH